MFDIEAVILTIAPELLLACAGLVGVLAGAMLASAIGFFGGRLLGRSAVERFSGSRLEQLSKQTGINAGIVIVDLKDEQNKAKGTKVIISIPFESY